VAAPPVYLAGVIAGGELVMGYDHLRDAISSLTESGRVGIEAVAAVFILYDLLVLAFADAASRFDRENLRAYVLLGVTAVGGLLMFIVPMDPVGRPMSPGGMVHVLLAVILSLSTMGAIAVVGLGAFRRRQRGRALFSGFGLIVVAVSGAAAGLGAAAGWPLMGILERLTIGGFEVWLLVQALTLVRLNGR